MRILNHAIVGKSKALKVSKANVQHSNFNFCCSPAVISRTDCNERQAKMLGREGGIRDYSESEAAFECDHPGCIFVAMELIDMVNLACNRSACNPRLSNCQFAYR